MSEIIVINRVQRVATKTKLGEGNKLVTNISVDAMVKPADLPSLHELVEKGVPLVVTIGTRQAEFEKEGKNA